MTSAKVVDAVQEPQFGHTTCSWSAKRARRRTGLVCDVQRGWSVRWPVAGLRGRT